jgi:uncharacterized RDD family membrane protein YckC
MRLESVPLEWLPSLPRRYLATVLDGVFILFLILAPTSIWATDDESSRLARIVIAVLAIFVYEPVCTGRFVTIGQYSMKVRVRKVVDGEKIGILRAYVRIIMKGFLGIISFLSLPLTAGRRALHDLGAGSIVVSADAEAEFRRWTLSKRAVMTSED